MNNVEGIKSVVVEQNEQTRIAIIDAIENAVHSRGLEKVGSSPLVSEPVQKRFVDQMASDMYSMENQALRSLVFDVKPDREEEIAEAEKGTFDWIFGEPTDPDRPWDSFNHWLRHQDGVYWIAGKPGSGKSTLMKYLFNLPRTRQALKEWVTGKRLLLAGFFFWNRGTQMQKSQDGVLRSLLHQCLSQCPELIPLVLISEMTRKEAMGSKSMTWTSRALERAFTRLVEQRNIPLSICLFIDGLDEYIGQRGEESDHEFLADLLKRTATSQRVKICTSSRPLLVFSRAFEGCPGLMLQNLTHKDIEIYVQHRFNGDTRMRQLETEEPQLAQKLSMEIVRKASGVFLWVRLVVQSLLHGIGNYDRVSDLELRLRELPEDLEELYLHMLQSVKPSFYVGQGSRLLLTVLHALRPMSILELAYSDLEDRDRALFEESHWISLEARRRMAVQMEGRLKSRCLGLLEASSPPHDGLPTYNSTETRVQFMHRSVAEFLETDLARKRMADSLVGQSFDPHLALMQACIVRLKHMRRDQDIWNETVSTIIRDFMEYTRLAEHTTGEAQIDFMGTFDRSVNHLWQKLSGFRSGHSPGCQWHDNVKQEDRRQKSLKCHQNSSILSYSIAYGHFLYARSIVRETRGNEQALTKSKLRFALDILSAYPVGFVKKDFSQIEIESLRKDLLRASTSRRSPFAAKTREIITRLTSDNRPEIACGCECHQSIL